MVDFRNFFKLKNILSRLNPIPSFRFDDSNEDVSKQLSQDNLLESIIKNYPKFDFAFLISLYHLFNSQGKTNEFLTGLTNI